MTFDYIWLKDILVKYAFQGSHVKGEAKSRAFFVM